MPYPEKKPSDFNPLTDTGIIPDDIGRPAVQAGNIIKARKIALETWKDDKDSEYQYDDDKIKGYAKRSKRLQNVNMNSLRGGSARQAGNPYSIDTRNLLSGVAKAAGGVTNNIRNRRREEFEGDYREQVENKQKSEQVQKTYDDRSFQLARDRTSLEVAQLNRQQDNQEYDRRQKNQNEEHDRRTTKTFNNQQAYEKTRQENRVALLTKEGELDLANLQKQIDLKVENGLLSPDTDSGDLSERMNHFTQLQLKDVNKELGLLQEKASGKFAEATMTFQDRDRMAALNEKKAEYLDMAKNLITSGSNISVEAASNFAYQEVFNPDKDAEAGVNNPPPGGWYPRPGATGAGAGDSVVDEAIKGLGN